ncbi:MAG: glycosyltransferase 87 family protein, partial [Gaiellales bacterium]
MLQGLFRTIARLGPHGILLIAAVLEVTLEAIHLQRPSSSWLILAAAVAAVALGLTWRLQDRLRLLPVALLAVGFHLSWAVLHQWTGQRGDQDTGYFYSMYGNELVDGRYPDAEYPVGAVLLFALETQLGGGSAEMPNRFLMVPFQLACVLAVWCLRTPHSGWLATVLAIWPMNTYYWQYRFDLVPAALIVVGLLLAYRSRWGWSGFGLAIGTAVKWTPALSFVVLAVWLVAGARWTELKRGASGFLGCLVLIHLPFLLWQPDRVLGAYATQGERAITNESVWFFPSWLLGISGETEAAFAPARAPHWADMLAVGVQAALVVGLIALAWRARNRIGTALVLAALAPVVFLLTNRIFSPQFLLVVTVALAFAGALAASGRREQLALGALLMGATFANAFVYPFEPPFEPRSWQPYSA